MKKYPLILLVLILLVAAVFVLKQVVDPLSPKTGSVRAGDIDIAYMTYGSGKPLIMIMGYGGTMDMWDTRFVKLLASKYKVIVFDNRGMGKTSAGEKMFSIELFAGDTAGLMDALNIKKAHVLGWSLGTYIAQELALNYPQKVEKLVLYAADVGGKEALDPDKETMDLLSDTSGDEREKGIRLLKTLFPPKWLKENPDPRKYFPKAVESRSPDNISRQFTAWREWKGTASRLPKLKVPTLLITGSEDILTPWQNSIMMAKLIPGAWLVQMSGAGHGLIFQYPERTGRAVAAFLEN